MAADFWSGNCDCGGVHSGIVHQENERVLVIVIHNQKGQSENKQSPLNYSVTIAMDSDQGEVVTIKKIL